MCVLSIKVPIRKKSLETYLMSLLIRNVDLKKFDIYFYILSGKASLLSGRSDISINLIFAFISSGIAS